MSAWDLAARIGAERMPPSLAARRGLLLVRAAKEGHADLDADGCVTLHPSADELAELRAALREGWVFRGVDPDRWGVSLQGAEALAEDGCNRV